MRATSSSRGGTSSNATRAVRTSKGSAITAVASTTAFHVNTISMPKVCSRKTPIGPRRPKSFSKISRLRPAGYQRQRHERLDQRLARPAPPRQQPAQRHAAGQDQQRAQQRDPKREERDWENVAHASIRREKPNLANTFCASGPARNATSARAASGNRASLSTATG